MLQFPPETMLEVGGVIVIANRAEVFRSVYGISPDLEMQDSDIVIPDMLPYFGWSTGSRVELVNSGDELLLLDGNDVVVDALLWGNSTWEMAFKPPPPVTRDGESLERSPAFIDTDTAANWIRREIPGPYQLDLRLPTPTASPTPSIPTGPTVLFVSEVLYDPSGEDPAGEWTELYNAGENNALLCAYRLGDEETQYGGEGMYASPCGAVVVFGDGMPAGIFGGAIVETSSTGTLGLTNGGETLSLYDISTILVDSYLYASEGNDDQSIAR